MSVEISKIKYPSMSSIFNLKPNPHILLGKDIIWTIKEDGSNAGIYLDEHDNLRIRSRNVDEAEMKFYKTLIESELYGNVKEYLLSEKYEYNKHVVVFGELCRKGKSPAKFEIFEKERFIIFDIFDVDSQRYLPYTLVHQRAYQFDIPVVELVGTCNCVNIETLYEFKDTMLDAATERSKEGVVGKVYYGDEQVFFKEKRDTPKYEKVPRVKEEGMLNLPPLEDPEIESEIHKVYMDLSENDFRNPRVAMPLIVERVNAEAKMRNCRPPKDIYQRYQQKLKEISL